MSSMPGAGDNGHETVHIPPRVNATEPEKSLGTRLFAFIEHPFTLGALFLLGGIVGTILFTPAFVVCAVCILLGFHRSGVVSGQPAKIQIGVYVAMAVVLTVAGYFLYQRLDSALQRMQAEFAKKVWDYSMKEGHQGTTGKVEVPEKKEPQKIENSTTTKKEGATESQPNIVRTPPKTNDEQPLTFYEQPSDEFTLLVPTNSKWITETKNLRLKGGWGPWEFDGGKPFSIYLDPQNNFHIDALIYDKAGNVTIEIRDNKFTLKPADWDRNLAPNALEVVNAQGLPVFQMIRRKADVIYLQGIFAGKHGGLVDYASNFPKTIFKYPSWKYPGQLAEQGQ